MKKTGLPAANCKKREFDILEVAKVYSLTEMYEGGYSVQELHSAGKKASEFKEEGFSVKVLCSTEGGSLFNRGGHGDAFIIQELYGAYSLNDIIGGGFTPAQVKEALQHEHEPVAKLFYDAGFGVNEIKGESSSPDFKVIELQQGARAR